MAMGDRKADTVGIFRARSAIGRGLGALREKTRPAFRNIRTGVTGLSCAVDWWWWAVKASLRSAGIVMFQLILSHRILFNHLKSAELQCSYLPAERAL